MPTRRRRRLWILFALTTWAGAGGLAFLFGWAEDRRFLLPGETTAGHHQIELKCSECHTPFLGVRPDACNRCHGAELAAVNDSHPRAKFLDPRHADRLTRLNAADCVTCHREHQPEFTEPMSVTQPQDFCYHCHQDIATERPTHAGLAFTTCATAGCHNFHDNTALYEDFVAKHRHEPETRTPARTRVRAAPVTPLAGRAPLTAAQRDAPAGVFVDQQLAYDWEQGAHAAAGVNCRDCHQAGGADSPWVERPAHPDCARCHAEETSGFLESRHGMRLAAGLGPMTPALARLAMHAAAGHRELTCNACHGAHRYDTRAAAVESCFRCHDDQHSHAYQRSPHAALWRAETLGAGAPGSGVSCATCHFPRETQRVDGREVIRVQHNQNATLRPNEKMIRPVCLDCHGYAFALDALADRALIDASFAGRPAQSVDTVGFVLRRLAERSPSVTQPEKEIEP
jgi:predicted CXXCH cytochrome family protein